MFLLFSIVILSLVFQEVLLVPVGLVGVILGGCPQKRLRVLAREIDVVLLKKT